MANGVPESKANETTKTLIAVIGSLFIGMFIAILIAMRIVPINSIIWILPLTAYLLTSGLSMVYQYTSCGTVRPSEIFTANLFILGTTAATAGLLALEALPVFKYMFGPYAARDPATGLPYPDAAGAAAAGAAVASAAATSTFGNTEQLVHPDGKLYGSQVGGGPVPTDPEAHYKISFFSGIVKAVLPVYFDESTKEGTVYMYWSFWSVLLPWYFTLIVQGIC